MLTQLQKSLTFRLPGAIFAGPVSPMVTQLTPKLLTISQAASRLLVSVSRMRRMIARRDIAYLKVKAQYRFTDEMLLNFIEAQAVKPRLIGETRRS